MTVQFFNYFSIILNFLFNFDLSTLLLYSFCELKLKSVSIFPGLKTYRPSKNGKRQDRKLEGSASRFCLIKSTSLMGHQSFLQKGFVIFGGILFYFYKMVNLISDEARILVECTMDKKMY